MSKFKPGARVAYRAYGGQVVTADVLKKFLFMRLIKWGVHDVDFGFDYDKVKWRPVWRLVEREKVWR